ncbi:MAG: ABC transporter permease [Lachnospiraceae bacterium]|nr:ABC transporter permease [Lachnospiraceae bacterium]
MKENFFSKLVKKAGFKSVVSSILCIVAGLLIGLVVMIILSIINERTTVGDAFYGLTILLGGPFSSGTSAYIRSNLGNMIFYATPLIMTGVSVAIAYKTGLFNIGAAGQFLMGLTGSLLVALNINTNGNPGLGVLVWILALVVGALCGMIWGAIPGFFRAVFNVNEVIVCIMTNWIAANIVTWIFKSMPHLANSTSGKTGYLITTGVTGNGTPTLGLDQIFKGSYIDAGIVVAILIAIGIYIMLNKTTFGYELRACGANRYGAKYAGMNEKRNIILSMAIAGGLAAIGGSLYYLNPGIEFKWDTAYQSLPDYGFNGIPAALLGSNNPIAVIFVALFIRYLNMGGQNLTSAGFNQYIADVIIALIIYFAGVSKLFRDILSRRKARVRTAAPQPTLGEKAALVNPAAAETVKEEADLKAPPEEAVEETAGEIAGEAAEEITEKTEQVSFEENEGKESKA